MSLHSVAIERQSGRARVIRVIPLQPMSIQEETT